MKQTWENYKKPDLGAAFGSFGAYLVPRNYFRMVYVY